MLTENKKDKILQKIKNSSKQSFITKINTSKSFVQSLTVVTQINSFDLSHNEHIDKLSNELLSIIKIRLGLGTIFVKKEDYELIYIIKNNLSKIDLKHFDVKNIHILVDDLMHVIKEKSNDEIIDISNPIYRPKPFVEDLKEINDQFQNTLRKRDKLRENKKSPLKFNLFVKNHSKEKIFHKENKIELDLDKMQNEFIDKEMESGKKKFFNFDSILK